MKELIVRIPIPDDLNNVQLDLLIHSVTSDAFKKVNALTKDPIINAITYSVQEGQ